MSWVRKNYFLLGIVAALTAGFLLAERADFLNPGGWTSRVLVFLMFLITGLKLPTNRIAQDLSSPRLHILIQLFIFLVPPLFFLTAQPLFASSLGGQLVVGIYALAVLPTTVSSCIMFTQTSGGNVVAAVFNATLANTIGIFLSPFLLSLLLSSTGRALPAEQFLITLRNLAINMLVPLAIGQLARIKARPSEKHGKRLSVLNNVLLLLVVTLAFARTTANPDLAAYAKELPLPILYLAGAHLLFVGLVYGGGRLLRLGDADLVTALYVAPQKTLALGAPLLTIYFAGDAILGIALLPLVFYHPFQLLVAGILRGTPLVKRAVAAQEGGIPS